VSYVAAFAQLSTRLAHDLSWPGTAEIAVLLLAVWWTWSITALTTEFYEPREPVIQRVIVSTMFGVVLMAVAIPAAFGQHGLVFASAYLCIHVVRGILLVSALRQHPLKIRPARFLSWFVASGFLWLAGGFLDSDRRLMLWAGAVVIEYVSAAVRYPLPKLGRVPLDQYDRLSTHFGERYQQIFILALGELVLAVTLRLSGLGLTTARVVVFIAAITIALLLWQIFVFRTSLFVAKAVRWYPRRAVRLAAYVYAAQVAGVVGTAAGVELAIREPFGTTQPGWVALIVGGLALFLLARVIFERELLGQISRSRVGWLVVLISVAPALELLAPIFVVIVTAGILLGVALTDAWRDQHDTSSR
jgi:low temperature requirement protein LtrA